MSDTVIQSIISAAAAILGGAVVGLLAFWGQSRQWKRQRLDRWDEWRKNAYVQFIQASDQRRNAITKKDEKLSEYEQSSFAATGEPALLGNDNVREKIREIMGYFGEIHAGTKKYDEAKYQYYRGKFIHAVNSTFAFLGSRWLMTGEPAAL
jgi:predicted acylesterase/phospholipase RssA